MFFQNFIPESQGEPFRAGGQQMMSVGEAVVLEPVAGVDEFRVFLPAQIAQIRINALSRFRGIQFFEFGPFGHSQEADHLNSFVATSLEHFSKKPIGLRRHPEIDEYVCVLIPGL